MPPHTAVSTPIVEIQDTPVPAIGLGTWRLSGRDAVGVVEDALDLGYRHLDTARMYGNESEIGTALRSSWVDRADVFLTTKIWWTDLAYTAVRPAAEDSLRRLQTDYIDLLLIHWPNPRYALAPTLEAMFELRAEGKVRHVGVSNFPPALLREALACGPLFCIQVEYHPFLGQDELLSIARTHDLLLTAYSPIAKGKVADEPVLVEIAQRHGKTPAQVALRWHIQQPQVAAIPKAANRAHRVANLELDFYLSPEEMDAIYALARGRRLVNPSFAPDW